MTLIRRLVPPVSVGLYQTNSLRAPDLSDLKVGIVGPGRSLAREQKDFLGRHIPALTLWRFLRFHRRGKGWIVFAASSERFVTTHS